MIPLTYILVLGTAATVAAMSASYVTAGLSYEKKGAVDSSERDIQARFDKAVGNFQLGLKKDLKKCYTSEMRHLTQQIRKATGEERKALSEKLAKQTQLLDSLIKPTQPSTGLSILGIVNPFSYLASKS